MKYLTTLLLGLFLTFCAREPSVVERVRDRGELRVVSVAGPATMTVGPNGHEGLEYDLARLFAEELGVTLRPLLVPSGAEAVAALVDGRADLAAGLILTPDRRGLVRVGPTYQQAVTQLVYRQGRPAPRTLQDLAGQEVEVLRGAVEAHQFHALTGGKPGPRWRETPAADRTELLTLVHEQLVDYAVATSQEIALLRRFFPELRVAFDLGDPLPIAWALPRAGDESLYRATVGFFNRLRQRGEIDRLIERHFGHVDQFDYLDVRALSLHVAQRLPELRAAFQAAAGKTGLDWRLLAALGYQESRWDPRAVSPTGVRGVMMLTQATARRLGVRREVPAESIDGAARYLALLKEPDRTWLALAAYNVGLGHLLDARRLTHARGGKPDLWVDVKKSLPLLSQPKWAGKTRHGRARGGEPVELVDSVRHYYDILVWKDGGPRPAGLVPDLPGGDLLPDKDGDTGPDKGEELDHVLPPHAHAPVGGGRAERRVLGGPVYIDVSTKGVDVAEPVSPPLQPAQPEDTPEDPVAPRLARAQFRGVELPGGPAPHEHRLGPLPRPDAGPDLVPASGRAAAAGALPRPVAGRGDRVVGDHPAPLVEPQPLLPEADLDVSVRRSHRSLDGTL
jgi:membrane-bound lytic murein transglycosylase F